MNRKVPKILSYQHPQLYNVFLFYLQIIKMYCLPLQSPLKLVGLI
jgi:hypothetical protein